MPQTPHVEKLFTSSALVRDIVIGMSDGLTVPFALAAGLSGGLSDASEASRIVITPGLADVASGAIAMGLGGYLAAKTDAEHFESERAREEREIKEVPDVEAAEIAAIFRSYGLNEEMVAAVVSHICADS